MDLQKFMLFVPFEIDDIVQIESQKEEYKILDIQHTYSAKEKTIIDVTFELENIVSKEISKIPYKDYTWIMIKRNDEEEE